MGKRKWPEVGKQSSSYVTAAQAKIEECVSGVPPILRIKTLEKLHRTTTNS